MAQKKRKQNSSEAGNLFLTILVILVILGFLYYLYQQQHKQDSPAHSRVEHDIPEDFSSALAYLNTIRKREDFAWPAVHTSYTPELIQYSSFALGYVEEHEQAAWVAYLLTSRHAQNTHERRNNFKSDPKVTTSSASPQDFTHSGYDRGHLAPAADFDFSKKALSETFFMSNMSPQAAAFNRGAWKELEDLVRRWASSVDSLHVVTGPVLEPGLKKIGKNRVSVPNYFYKIILDSRQPEVKVIAFLMPNQKISDGPQSYVVTVDSLESLCGLDFFPQLPDILENSLERTIEAEAWFSIQTP